MPYITIENKKCFYAGNAGKPGVPVVFCHGSGGNHRHWLYQLDTLQGSEINPIAVDLPGHGLSAGEAADNIAAYRTWIHYFISTLGLAQPILAGHSMGGAIALDYALNYPGLSGLILVGTGGRLRVAPAILDSLRKGLAPPDMTAYAYGPSASPELLEKAKKEVQSTPASVFLADFSACDRFDVMDQLPAIELPSLVICGAVDRLTPLKYSHFLTERLPHGELVEVADAGHMVMLEEPDEVNRAIRRFVKGRELNDKD